MYLYMLSLPMPAVYHNGNETLQVSTAIVSVSTSLQGNSPAEDF